MSWNHRVVKLKTRKNRDYYAIYEVYYDIEDGCGLTRTEEPVVVAGESVESLKWTLERMQRCLGQPVLVEVDGKLVEET